MYELNVEGTLRVSRFSGRVTAADLADAVMRLKEVVDSAPADALVDLTQAESIDFHSDAVRSIAEWSNRRPANARPQRVAIAVADAVAYGYVRAFQMLGGDGMEMRIFRSSKQAREWLRGEVTEPGG